MGEVTTKSRAGSSRDKKEKTQDDPDGLKNKPPIETKERNIWRGRRLEGERGENSFKKQEKGKEEAISRPVRGPSLTVLVYVHIYQYIYIGDIFCYMLLCIYQCILIYIDVCYCTYTIYIYIY